MNPDSQPGRGNPLRIPDATFDFFLHRLEEGQSYAFKDGQGRQVEIQKPISLEESDKPSISVTIFSRVEEDLSKAGIRMPSDSSAANIYAQCFFIRGEEGQPIRMEVPQSPNGFSIYTFSELLLEAEKRLTE